MDNKKKGEDSKFDSPFLHSLYPDGNGPDSDLILGIENTLIKKNTNVLFEDIAGLKDAKRSL